MYWGRPEVTERITATLGSAAAISSMAKAQVTESSPAPPQASGVVMPRSPSWASCLSWGQGYCPVRSYSGAIAHSTSRETARTMSSSIFWSVVKTAMNISYHAFCA